MEHLPSYQPTSLGQFIQKLLDPLMSKIALLKSLFSACESVKKVKKKYQNCCSDLVLVGFNPKFRQLDKKTSYLRCNNQLASVI